MIDRRPSIGGGSCSRCGESLGLASIKVGGVWYCGTACAEGRAPAQPRTFSVPEPWLYARPRRFYRARRPRELNSTSSGS